MKLALATADESKVIDGLMNSRDRSAVGFADDLPAATVARGVLRSVPISLIDCNPDNPRSAESVKANAERLARSIEENGFDPSAPLVVEVQKNGRHKAWRGNCRLTAINIIATGNPKRFAELFPTGEVPCVVYDSLSRDEKLVVLNDFGKDRRQRNLDKEELAALVRFYVRNNFCSRKDVARLCGITEPLAQRYVALAKLPPEIQTAFRLALKAGPSLAETKLRVADILNVARDYSADMAGFVAGPVWASWLAGTHADSTCPKPGSTPTAPVPSAGDLLANANAMNSPTMRAAITAGDAAGMLERIDAAAAELETDAAFLRDLKLATGDAAFAKLVAKVEAYRAKNAAPTA